MIIIMIIITSMIAMTKFTMAMQSDYHIFLDRDAS